MLELGVVFLQWSTKSLMQAQGATGTPFCAIAAAAGGGIGLGAATEAGAPQLLALAGSFVAACLGVAAGAWLAGLAQQRPWGRILVRVAGSWMAAAALLVLALLHARG